MNETRELACKKELLHAVFEDADPNHHAVD